MHSSSLRILICQATYYPGLCEPTSQGGLGFDYYVNLSASEMWSSFLQDVPDHEWSMNKVVFYSLWACLMHLNHLEGFPFIKVGKNCIVQIVSSLIDNRHYANKMLLYAENHSQVIFFLIFLKLLAIHGLMNYKHGFYMLGSVPFFSSSSSTLFIFYFLIVISLSF